MHGNTIRLNEQRPSDFEQALRSCGYSHERARSVSFKSGGRIVILKRLLLDLSTLPDWAAPTEAGELRLAALIGSWDGSNEEDRDVIQDYLGKEYGEWIQTVRPKTLLQDPPLTQQGEQWRFVSRFEGWLGLGPFLSRDDLNRFRRMAVQVLSEKDPKFDLPSEKRWLAVIHEKTRKYSDLLREGIAETLALLGTYPDAIASCSNASVRTVAAATVHDLLSGADWILWASLQDVLPLLAESSPEQFLDAVENNVVSLVELYQQEAPGPTGGTHMAGLLWALETLAWHPNYLTRVTLILGKLAESDPGGRWNNRPSNSLTTIFLPWLPQTCASLEKRRGALELLLRDHPDVGWKLLLELLPTGHQVSTGSRKPAWREWIPQDWQNGATPEDYSWQVEQYARLLAESAATVPNQLIQLIERLDNLPRPALGKVLEHLSSEAVRSLPEQERLPVWEAIMSLVSKHRRFFDAEWAMPHDLVSQLAATAEAIAPGSPELLYRRLFNEGDLELMDQPSDDYQGQIDALEARRRAAVSEIFAGRGLEGVVQLAKTVRTSWRVGTSLGEFAPSEVDASILPPFLGSDDKSLSQFVAGFVWARFKIRGRPWATGVFSDEWNLTQKVEFLVRLPFEKETWELAALRLGGDVSNYWADASANPYEVLPSDLPEAANHLLLSNRPDAALRCIDWALRKKTVVDPQLVTRTLKQLMEKQGDLTAVDFHQCMEIIGWLQRKLGPDNIDLQTIEWQYLALFDRRPGITPRTLERRLATDPEFFAEVIRASFRPEHSESLSEPSEHDLKVAENAHRLLRDWRVIPGSESDGSIDGVELDRWLSGARDACKKSDHLNVALTIIGQVLSHAPADPDGTWIDRSVATVLDTPDGEKIRQGFASGILSSRGAHWGTKGEDERKLSEAYKNKASGIDHLYPRLATTVRKIAQWYENLAEEEASAEL